jgi:hypothetical protein
MLGGPAYRSLAGITRRVARMAETSMPGRSSRIHRDERAAVGVTGAETLACGYPLDSDGTRGEPARALATTLRRQAGGAPIKPKTAPASSIIAPK